MKFFYLLRKNEDLYGVICSPVEKRLKTLREME